MPPGLALGTDGRWSGTATTPGTYTFTITICDIVDQNSVQLCNTYDVTVVVTSPSVPTTPTTTPRVSRRCRSPEPLRSGRVRVALLLLGLGIALAALGRRRRSSTST